MKKLLIFLLLIPTLVFCQPLPDTKTIPVAAKTAVIAHFFDDELNFHTVDFGGFTYLKDTMGTACRFKTYFSALQYMNSQGWEYVSTFNDVGIDGRTDQVILIKKKGT